MDLKAAVEAVQNGDLSSLKVTQQLAVEKDDEGVTLLHWAAYNNRCRIATILIDNGADVNSKGGAVEETPLMWAMRRKFYAMSALLIDHGADIHALSRTGDDLVHNCVKVRMDTEGDIQGLFLALQWGVGTDHRDNRGETALSWLAKNRVGDYAHDLMRLIMKYHDEDVESVSYKKQRDTRPDKNSLLHLLCEKSGINRGYKARYTDMNIALDIHQHPDIASWHNTKDSSAKENSDGMTPYDLAGGGDVHTYMNYFLIDAMQYNVLPKFVPGVSAVLIVLFTAVLIGRYWWLWGSLWWGFTVPFLFKFSLQWNIPEQNAASCAGLVVGVAILMIILMQEYEPSFISSSLFWIFLSLTASLSLRLSNTAPVTLPAGDREELARDIIAGSPQEGPYGIEREMNNSKGEDKENYEENSASPASSVVVYTGPLVCGACICDKRFATNHCNLCNRCVCGQDAHIPHLGVCAGQGNRRLFCFTLAAMALACAMFVFIAYDFHATEVCPDIGYWFIFHYMAVELCVAYDAPVHFGTWFIAFSGMCYTMTILYTDLLFVGKELTLNLAANRLVTSLPTTASEIFSRNLRRFFREGTYGISFGDSRVEYSVPVRKRKEARDIDVPWWFRSVANTLLHPLGPQIASGVCRTYTVVMAFIGEFSGAQQMAPIFQVDSESSDFDDRDFDRDGSSLSLDDEEKQPLTNGTNSSSNGCGDGAGKTAKEVQLHMEVYARLELMAKSRQAYQKVQEDAKKSREQQQQHHGGKEKPCCEHHTGPAQPSGTQVAVNSSIINAEER